MPEGKVAEAESCQDLTKNELQELLGPRYMVESFTSRRLTQPGDNYFSNMQALEVTLLPDHNTLSLVAKLPPVSAFIREISQFGYVLRKEARMYLEVSKVFRDIHQDSNVPIKQVMDFFPKFYGAHVPYVDDKPVAEKSVLLLENLVTSGYQCVDRIAGLDFTHTELAVSRLAQFHATAVAVRLKKPLLFKNVILMACEHVMPTGPPPDESKMEDKIIKQLERIQGIDPYIEQLKVSVMKKPDIFPSPKEPFASIKHADFWTNNMMFKYSADSPGSLPTDVKFVDFQMTQYDSPAKDLIFFLYSSTQLGLVVEHYNHFVQLYHEQFIGQLAKLGCDTAPFSFDVLKEEIDRVAPEELQHCLFMANVITKDKSDAIDMSDITSHEDLDKVLDSTKSVAYEKKILELVTEFSNKGWL